MALQVWLPLNGDLHNQGLLEDLTINSTNVSFLDNGKIGKCFTGHTGYFNIPYFTGKKQFSVAYWVKVNTATATNWLDAFRWYSTDGSSSYGSRNEFYTNCTKTGFWFAGSPNSISGKDTTVGEWHHHAFVIDYSAGTAQFYIDGVSVGAVTGVYTTHSLTGENFMIGENGLDASINDVRIYDNCLSPKEVKELSKGLVAHYPLNDGIGGANIAWNSSLTDNLTSWVKSGTWDFVTKDGFQCCHNTGAFKTTSLIYPKQTFNTTTDGMLPYNGLIMTMSADVLLENVVKGTTNYFLALYKSGETIDGSWKAPTILANSGHFTSAASETLEPSKLNGKGWTHVWITYKWGDYAWSNTNYRLQFYARDYTGDVYVKNLKIELGEKATPWIPNPADALYSKMGLDNGIVYDCSGYGHDARMIGTPIVFNDPPRYSVCQLFTNDVNTRYICDIYTLRGLTMNEVSVSIWFKTNTINDSLSGDGGNFYSFGYNNGLRVRIPKSNGAVIWVYSHSSAAQFTYSSSLADDKWHHLVIVFDNGLMLCYIDGSQIESAVTKSSTTITFADNEYYRIATAQNGSEHFIGSLSDLRIYATALSAEDIKSLYETAASIDDHGNVYGYELEEV